MSSTPTGNGGNSGSSNSSHHYYGNKSKYRKKTYTPKDTGNSVKAEQNGKPVNQNKNQSRPQEQSGKPINQNKNQPHPQGQNGKPANQAKNLSRPQEQSNKTENKGSQNFSQGNKGKTKKPYGGKPNYQANGRTSRPIRHTETINDIKQDIVRIEKEIKLEIQEIQSMTNKA